MLGPLEVRDDAGDVPVRRGRPRRLLLALLVRPNEPVGFETLIEQLWGGRPPQNAANALQVLVSYLRKVIGPGSPAVRLETTESGYRLAVTRDAVDALRFEDVVMAGPGERDPAPRLAELDAALALWRGAPFSEATYDDFAAGEIVRLNELRVLASEQRIDALLELGRQQEVIGLLGQLVAEHPLRERFHAQLMVALYRSGRQADALRAFDAARTRLAEELGLDPGPELRALQRAVLEQADEIATPARAATGPPDAAAPAARGEVGMKAERGAEGAPTPIPTSVTPLFGRGDVLEHLAEVMAAHRIVTLTGTGGAGKSRLAAALATDAAARAAVWWVDLTAADDRDSVLSTIAAATGAPSRPDDDGESMIAFLSGRTGLLVLDTCEHVIDQVRDIVTRVVASGGALDVLATSRQPLRLDGELAWPVPPLALPDPAALDLETVRDVASVQLFCARAASARAGFALTTGNVDAVARICLLLDGIPLALELAAAQIAMFGPGRLLGLLDDRLRVLVDDRATGRRQTLRSTIDWSFQLLEAEERSFLARLSVFAGSFDVEAAIVVAGHDLTRDGYELLLALVRQSLVTTDADDRFRLLDTIRAFAAERLDDADGAATRQRHARWFTDFAVEADRQLRGGDTDGWVRALRAELPNLREALQAGFASDDPASGVQLAAALGWFWGIEGLFAEAEQWLRAAAAAAIPETIDAATVLAGQAVHAASLGDLERAEACSRDAARIHEAHGDRRGQARSLLYLGIAQWGLGALDDAAATQDLGAALYRADHDDWGLGLTLLLRGRTGADRDEEDLDQLLDTALAVSRRAGDTHVIGLCLDQRSREALRQGHVELAVQLGRESLEHNETAGYVEGAIASMHALGAALAAQGHLADARSLHRRAMAAAVELDHPAAMAEGLERLAGTDAAADPVLARTYLAAADALRARRAVPRPPSFARQLEPARTTVAAALDDDRAARADRAGALLDLHAFLET